MPARKDFAPGEFCWIDLTAHDMASARDWYGQLFGWSYHDMPTSGGGPPYTFCMKDGAVAAGMGEMNEPMKAQGIPPMWNSYVASVDCAATEAGVKRLGGTVTVPTMEVPGHGKLAFFLDPEGASFAAWQDLSTDSPGILVQDHGSLSWNELMTRDPSKAREFYGALFGWDFADMPMDGVDYTVIKHKGGDRKEQDGGGFMPMTDRKFDGIPAHWMVYFAVDDCDATTAKVQGSGGSLMVPPTDIPVGKFSVVADPQGAGFSLITLKDAPGPA